MIYRGTGFLAAVWFGSSATPSPPLPSLSSTDDVQKDWEIGTTCWREGGGGGRGAELYDPKKPGLYKSFNTLWLTLLMDWLYPLKMWNLHYLGFRIKCWFCEYFRENKRQSNKISTGKKEFSHVRKNGKSRFHFNPTRDSSQWKYFPTLSGRCSNKEKSR
jgi:hypothetical protein